MTAMEIARKLAELQQVGQAQQAFAVALGQPELSPEEELEASSYLFFSEADHRLPFTHFVSLYNRGLFQNEILELMTQAFYLPNRDKQQKQYEKNCQALEKYPFLFQKDFLAMDDLPILFFPFDNDGFVPFYRDENRFGDYVDFDDPIIDRWFFKDLSKPILAADVYSQYQLEYLNDMVRPSEWVGKENHIYLHYTDWAVFCAYLQVLNFKKIIPEKKFIFLIGDQVARYPIDFAKEYDIDYTQYPVRPVGVREVNKLVWHTQLATHNGGDFFNEICYDHPNMIVMDSLILEDVMKNHAIFKKEFLEGKRNNDVYTALAQIKNPTDKDIFVAMYLFETRRSSKPDPNSRIVPAIFFQPHFYNMRYQVDVDWEKHGSATLYSKQYEAIQHNPIFKGFKYIKTFTPMRRPTTSHAASVRFVVEQPAATPQQRAEDEKTGALILDPICVRLLNRSFMVDPWDRLYRDSRLVRFEDGKINPVATFTALAEFLDIPYTESMTYCSGVSGINPESLPGNDLGFSLAAIQRTYPEYANDEERAFIEYFFRDAYQAYGYDFQYYKGEPVNEAWIRNKIDHFTTADKVVRDSVEDMLSKQLPSEIRKAVEEQGEKMGIAPDEVEETEKKFSQLYGKKFIDMLEKNIHETRLGYAKALLRGLNFVNREHQPLQLMPPLKLDPDLLQQPLYH